MKVLASAAFGLALVSSAACAADSEPAVNGFVAHRAVYDVSLVKVTGKSNLTNVTGRIVNQINGSSCEGFSTQFRFVTRMASEAGEPRLTDIRTTTFETGDGSVLNFVNQNYMNGRQTEDGKGVARSREGETQVEVSVPSGKTLTLPGNLSFPTAHLGKIIEAARAGKTVAEIGLYDGTDGGDRYYRTTVLIGPQITSGDVGDEKAADVPELKSVRRWPVTISYFDAKKTAGGEDLPEYELFAVLYENGISRGLKLYYGDFTLAAQLTQITMLDQKPCK